MLSHNKASLKDIRRQLRQEMTHAEVILWKKLRNGRFLSLKIKRQHSIGNYIVDFYCANPRLIIEIDGHVKLLQCGISVRTASVPLSGIDTLYNCILCISQAA